MYNWTLGLTCDLLGADVSIQHKYFIISYYKLILIYIYYKYIFNNISFVNIEINSLLKTMIYQV